MAWFRLEESAANHRKIRKLKRKLGVNLLEARGLVMGLWCTVVADAPDGDLDGWDSDDVALACGWDGSAGDLVGALLQTGLLEVEEGRWIVHGWLERAESYRRAQAEKARRKSIKRGSRMHHEEGTPGARVGDNGSRVDGPTDRQTDPQTDGEEYDSAPRDKPSPRSRSASPSKRRNGKTTWLTPIADALDESGFTLPPSGSREAKALYGALSGELKRFFVKHGREGRTIEDAAAYVAWTVQHLLGGRFVAKFHGDPVEAVPYLLAVVSKPATMKQYRAAKNGNRIAAWSDEEFEAHLARWQSENDKRIKDSQKAGGVR